MELESLSVRIDRVCDIKAQGGLRECKDGLEDLLGALQGFGLDEREGGENDLLEGVKGVLKVIRHRREGLRLEMDKLEENKGEVRDLVEVFGVLAENRG